MVGFLLFVLIAHLLLLYILNFCALAGPRVSRDWLTSSLLTVLIDQLAFELAPALAVGLLGVLRTCCRRCSGSLWVAVLIELYRAYRNLL